MSPFVNSLNVSDSLSQSAFSRTCQEPPKPSSSLPNDTVKKRSMHSLLGDTGEISHQPTQRRTWSFVAGLSSFRLSQPSSSIYPRVCVISSKTHLSWLRYANRMRRRSWWDLTTRPLSKTSLIQYLFIHTGTSLSVDYVSTPS